MILYVGTTVSQSDNSAKLKNALGNPNHSVDFAYSHTTETMNLTINGTPKDTWSEKGRNDGVSFVVGVFIKTENGQEYFDLQRIPTSTKVEGWTSFLKMSSYVGFVKDLCKSHGAEIWPTPFTSIPDDSMFNETTPLTKEEFKEFVQVQSQTKFKKETEGAKFKKA